MKFRKLALILGLCLAPMVTSCSQPSEFETKTLNIYNKAVENGFTGSYEDWLASIHGEAGKDGKSIVSIAQKEIKNGVAYYTITFNDGSTSEISIDLPENGKDGEKGDTGIKGDQGEKGDKGETGPQGPAGQDGADGVDGDVPFIGKNGNWWIGDKDTGIKAKGDKGQDGEKGDTGAQGEKGDQGLPGENGQDGLIPHIGSNGNWFVGEEDTGIKASSKDGENGKPGENGLDGTVPHIGQNGNWFIGEKDTGITAKGDKGDIGAQGEKGDQGAQGEKGDTGAAGQDGNSPVIGSNGNWWIGNVDTNIPARGDKGDTGAQGEKGDQGIKGNQGAPGKDGADGLTPTIGSNGNWFIGDKDTGVKAEASNGQNGQDGTNGKDGNTPYVGENGNWWIDGVDTTIKAVGNDGQNGQDGADGQDGINGLSAYEIYIKYHPEYKGTEEDWINDLIEGNLHTGYGVIYDINGELTEPVFLKRGEYLVEPEAPVVPGYTFGGWFKGSHLWDFNKDVITGPTTLKAKLIANTSGEIYIKNSANVEIQVKKTAKVGEIIDIYLTPAEGYEINYVHINGMPAQFIDVNHYSMVMSKGLNILEVNTIKESPIQITLSGLLSQNLLTHINEVLPSFKMSNPDIEVTIDNDIDSLENIKNGKKVDLYYSPNHAVNDLFDYSLPLDLTNYIHDSEIGFTKYEYESFKSEIKNQITNYKYPGNYEIPFSFNADVLIYRKDILESLSLPGINNGNPIDENYLNSISWNEFYEKLCPAIIKEDQNQNFINKSDPNYSILCVDNDFRSFLNMNNSLSQDMITYNGVYNTTFNTKAFQNSALKLMDYTGKHYINSSNYLKNVPAQAINNGTVLFSSMPLSDLALNRVYDYQTGVMKMPTIDGNRRENTGVLKNFSILKSYDATGHFEEEKAKAAFKLLKFLETNQEFQLKYFNEHESIPISEIILINSRYIEYIQDDYRCVLKAIKYTLADYSSYKFVNNSISADYLIEAFNPLLSYLYNPENAKENVETIRQNLDDISRNVNILLNGTRPL